MRIDSHQHFWIYNRQRDSWITDEMQVIQRNFLPADLDPILKEHQFDGCVAVQADQSEEENSFLLSLTQKYPFIKGIVGWVDLRNEKLPHTLERYTSIEKLKGFRHIVQAEQKGFMLQPEFIQGVALLHQHNFTYDILIKESQLEEAVAFVQKLPDQKLVIDHIAKPLVGSNLSYWKKYLSAIAKHENVCCKLSGMVTEANWKNWKAEDFTPYLDTVFNVFGSKRVMYGSDWPVCLVAAQYVQQLKLVTGYIQSFSESEKEAIMGENAVRFYNL
ncbi:MAG: amidohydrolase family protein [Cyclobacteriaceae bacterium]|nr:amidohydrolase family protein [Cyclobacteriaceae bacterium]